MQTKFIEASDGSNFNWGKFAVCRFTPEEWARRSEVDVLTTRGLLSVVGWDSGNLLVLDLQTGEGARFKPGGLASADLNDKHQVWVCPMFEPFLTWLYTQDLSDLDKLPGLVNLGDVPIAMHGYRRQRRQAAESE